MISLINPTNFRFSVVCATFAERPLYITDIHGDEEIKGLKDYEVKFLELIEKISSGAKIEIAKSGTSARYYPGIIFNNGGVDFEFDCGTERGIGYFLEPLICLGLFGKSNLEITLQGVTNEEADLSVDYLSQNFLPQLKNFGVEMVPQIKVLKRGFKPLGGGEIHLSLSFVKFLKGFELKNKGKIKRIRGVASASKVAIQTLNRMISSAREIFNDYIPDVWIYSDYLKGNKGGLSNGYAISLTAESNSGGYIGVEEVFKLGKNAGDEENLPEITGKRCALRLLDEIYYSGFVDSSIQSSMLLLMALSEKKVSSLPLGRITPYTIDCLRILRDFLGVVFKIDEYVEKKEEKPVENTENEDKIEEENESQTSDSEIKLAPKIMLFRCLGIGLINLARNAN